MRKIKYKLIDLNNGCFFVQFEDDFDMSMAFLRYQEYQESPKFARKKFTITEFMAWYSKENDPKERKFTYARDWAGFNIPGSLVVKLLDSDLLNNATGIGEFNEYDQTMCNICEELGDMDWPDPYLISAKKNTKNDRKELILHELSHAMYYIDKEYRQGCREIYSKTNKKLLKKLTDIIASKGYANIQRVLEDELQAFLVEDRNWFDRIKGIEKLKKDIKKLHSVKFKEFIGEKELKKLGVA